MAQCAAISVVSPGCQLRMGREEGEREGGGKREGEGRGGRRREGEGEEGGREERDEGGRERDRG